MKGYVNPPPLHWISEIFGFQGVFRPQRVLSRVSSEKGPIYNFREFSLFFRKILPLSVLRKNVFWRNYLLQLEHLWFSQNFFRNIIFLSICFAKVFSQNTNEDVRIFTRKSSFAGNSIAACLLLEKKCKVPPVPVLMYAPASS